MMQFWVGIIAKFQSVACPAHSCQMFYIFPVRIFLQVEIFADREDAQTMLVRLRRTIAKTLFLCYN